MENKLNTGLVQKLSLNQNLKYAIELLKLNNYELEKEIEKISQENIFIDLPENKNIISSTYNNLEDKTKYINALQEKNNDYRDDILNEFIFENKDNLEYKLAEYIVYNLDEKGFLDISISKLAYIFNTSTDIAQKVINRIQNLSIKGIATRNTKDFLIFQAKDRKLKYFIEKYYEPMLKGKVLDILNTDSTIQFEFRKYLKQMKNFKLYPLQNIYINMKNPDNTIIDIIAEHENNINDIEVKLSTSLYFDINQEYIDMMNIPDKATKNYLKTQYDKACFIKNAINERNKNILLVTKAITEHQKNYLFGQDCLKVLTMKKISDMTNLSISTVSRVVNNKNLLCKDKVYSLKSLFISGITCNGVEYSSDEIKRNIILKIKSENKKHPLSDKELELMFNNENIPIKRRTIAKYRQDLCILNSNERKYIYLLNKFIEG